MFSYIRFSDIKEMPAWVAFDYSDRPPRKGEKYSIGHLSRMQRNGAGTMVLKAQSYEWENVRIFARVEAGNTEMSP